MYLNISEDHIKLGSDEGDWVIVITRQAPEIERRLTNLITGKDFDKLADALFVMRELGKM